MTLYAKMADQTALEETGIEQKAQIDLVETGTKETIVETGIDQMSGSGIETMTGYIKTMTGYIETMTG